MNKENNLIKPIFTEKDFEKFADIEILLKEAKPSFDDAFEKELIKKIALKNKSNRFFLKSAIAASLLITFLLFSFFFFKSPETEKTLSVSNEALSEVLTTIGGREELRLDEIFSLIESKRDETSENHKNYIEYYFGESDEEDFS